MYGNRAVNSAARGRPTNTPQNNSLGDRPTKVIHKNRTVTNAALTITMSGNEGFPISWPSGNNLRLPSNKTNSFRAFAVGKDTLEVMKHGAKNNSTLGMGYDGGAAKFYFCVNMEDRGVNTTGSRERLCLSLSKQEFQAMENTPQGSNVVLV